MAADGLEWSIFLFYSRGKCLVTLKADEADLVLLLNLQLLLPSNLTPSSHHSEMGPGPPFLLIPPFLGAGLHTAASCWWDATTDGSRTVRWENKTMYCICTVFGLAV